MKRNALRLALCILSAACSAGSAGPCDAGGSDCVALTIPRGATLRSAVDSLAAHQLVTHPAWFALYARLCGLGRGLKSGSYAFHRDAGWSDIIAALQQGRGTLVRFTVPEGLRLTEVADLAARELGVPRDSFLAAGRDPVILRDLGLHADAASVEGYLYPTTYTMRPHSSARELVRLMTDQFTAHWSRGWQARLDTVHLSRHQAVTLASIIESEVRYAPDRDYVSAVYHNRLQRGMPLQADPTVVYAMGQRPRRVYEKNLEIRSPYNTYLHTGLPPGPISQPDSASLAAALYPAPAPYLYFVAQPDGKHIFSATYTEHLSAIRQVKDMASDVRPTRRPGP